jgi:hypothetical protein
MSTEHGEVLPLEKDDLTPYTSACFELDEAMSEFRKTVAHAYKDPAKQKNAYVDLPAYLLRIKKSFSALIAAANNDDSIPALEAVKLVTWHFLELNSERAKLFKELSGCQDFDSLETAEEFIARLGLGDGLDQDLYRNILNELEVEFVADLGHLWGEHAPGNPSAAKKRFEKVRKFAPDAAKVALGIGLGMAASRMARRKG